MTKNSKNLIPDSNQYIEMIGGHPFIALMQVNVQSIKLRRVFAENKIGKNARRILLERLGLTLATCMRCVGMYCTVCCECCTAAWILIQFELKIKKESHLAVSTSL